MIASLLLATLPAYLLGSVPFAILTSRAFGLADPRSYGSKNPGATNVLRSGHKLAALLTLLGDGAKGALAVLLARHFFAAEPVALAAAALAVFLGHLYPIFLRGKGGKGVATAAGVLLATHPALGGLALATWLGVAALTRYSSLAALSAATLAPLACWWLTHTPAQTAAVLIMSSLLIWRHRDNIRRLSRGEESRLGKKKSNAA